MDSGELPEVTRSTTIFEEQDTAERIANWLDTWEPTIAEANALYGAFGEEVAFYGMRESLLSDGKLLSFHRTCLIVIAAIRAGEWCRNG